MIIRELAARLGLHLDHDSFQAAEKALSVVKGGYLALGAAAGAAALAVAAAVAKTAKHAEELSYAAQKTGIEVEQLQALQYAAERANVGLGGLQSAMRYMARKGVKDFEAEFRRAADELHRMPDGAAKTARAIELFGRTGESLIPMLNKGSEGLDEMRAKAREFGLVLNQEMIAEGVKTKDVLDDIQGVLRGITYTIGSKMMKPVREVLLRLKEWVLVNKQFIAQRMEQTFRALAWALAQIVRLAEPVVDILSRIFDFIGEHRALAITAGAALALIFAPALAAGLALFALIEEIWGWVTGKRKTVLEDIFGPWAEAKELPGIKILLWQLENVKRVIDGINAGLEAMRDLLNWLRTGKMPGLDDLNRGGVRTSQTEALGTAGSLVAMGGPIFGPLLYKHWLSNKTRAGQAGEDAALRREIQRAPNGPWAPTINIGDVTVSTQGGNGAEIAGDFVREMRTQLDAYFTGKVRESAPMVTR